MDVITHLALGTCIAEILPAKRLGKKGLLWGAAAQALPDIDTFPAFFFPADEALLIHRGLTHSLLFALTAGALLAFLVQKIYSRAVLSYTALLFFFCLQLTLHDLIDTCNSYGTGLLEPFSHRRFSINLLYVADPLFTAGLLVGSLVLFVKPVIYPYRKKWVWAMLLISACYTGYAGLNKAYINHRIIHSFKSQHFNPAYYFTTPAPFNCMLWYIVAAIDSGYYTAYSSVWDDPRQPVRYEKQLKNEVLANQIGDKRTLQHLVTFSDRYYTFSKTGSSLYFNVLKFGQVQGWRVPNAPFVLRYPLTAGNKTVLLLQGRLVGWNKSALKAYFWRIAGHQP
ncbi:metal-dependent hydrolase [Mucilaginibacter sp.]|uniref:metal-dependent hydrolase n=1 Tax=Mucilaginibacter sp. TaxID=1882438 RepID=UPI0026220222|nr:metal-dependent hydrolase [Mucilaginibacter sp.]MDB4924431.1 inner rane protein [Mucilaginibacter sp.]